MIDLMFMFFQVSSLQEIQSRHMIDASDSSLSDSPIISENQDLLAQSNGISCIISYVSECINSPIFPLYIKQVVSHGMFI